MYSTRVFLSLKFEAVPAISSEGMKANDVTAYTCRNTLLLREVKDLSLHDIPAVGWQGSIIPIL